MTEILELYPYLFPVFFVVMWIFVLSMLSALGGWGSLKEWYKFDGDFDGSKAYVQSLSMQRLKVMPVSYSGIVVFGTDSDGLYVELFFLFRLFHPPLYIPYTDIVGVERKMFFFKYIDLKFSKANDVDISISIKQARWMEKASNGAWSYLSGNA